jgi:hypothetical protein
MSTALWLIVPLLLLYGLIRKPFARLPLHIDTGFYVSNHTVVTRRWHFAEGWNAHFAGCSKVLPEAFYSLVYRLHALDYAKASRHYASIYNAATALAVGILAEGLFGPSEAVFFAAFLAFCLLSSEAHYGVYHECAELFELLPQTAGLACVVVGLGQGDPVWFLGGALCWAMEVFFIKLSSAPAFAVLFGGLAVVHPWTLAWTAVAFSSALVLYLAWIRWNGRAILDLLRPLRGHEACFQPRMNGRLLIHRFFEKARGAARVVVRQPLLPALAVVGICIQPAPLVFWVYLLGVTVSYVGQAADCRYYLIPFLPPLALAAAPAVVTLLELGWPGWTVPAVLAGTWLAWNPIRAARFSDASLNRWCWKGFRPAWEYETNQRLHSAAPAVLPRVKGRTMLVYGPFNQAYVLLRASYVTPIVAPESYLDPVCPGWQVRHNERLLRSPPDFILDTGACFDSQEARTKLGLDYRLDMVIAPVLRLFKLNGETAPSPDHALAATYRPQSLDQLRREEASSGCVTLRSETLHDSAIRAADGPLEGIRDEQQTALASLLRRLQQDGYRKLAVYGAGRFTTRLAETYRQSPVPVSVVLDDNAGRFQGRFLDWPIRPPDDAVDCEFDAIIISSDRFARPLAAKARQCFGDRVPSFLIPVRIGTDFVPA